MQTPNELIEITLEDRLIGWQDPLTGKVIPFIHGGATSDEEEEEESEDEEEEEEESEDEDEEDEDEDEEEEEEEDEDEPTISQKEMKRIASKEKKDGRRSGRNAVLKELGVGSLEEAKRKLAKSGKSKPKSKEGEGDDTDDSDEEAREQAERDRKKARTMGKVERKLIAAGAPDDDRKLAGLVTMLDLEIDDLTDDEDITTAVDELKNETPALFGKSTTKKVKPKSTSSGGRSGRRTKPKAGAGRSLLESRHPGLKNKK